MPTYTFTRTREQLTTKILRKLGVIDAVETPSGEDSALVYEAMDLRLKELHALGILWWNVAGGTTDVALTSGSITSTISATDFLFPVTMSLRVGTEDIQLDIIDHREYHAISEKDESGEPEMVYINGATCRFWPKPSANYTAKLTYEAIAADTETSARPDVNVECLRAFATLIAGDLGDEYEIKEPKASRLLMQAQDALRTIRALNAQHADTNTVSTDWF